MPSSRVSVLAAASLAVALAVARAPAARADAPRALPDHLPATAGTAKITNHERLGALEVGYSDGGKSVHDQIVGEHFEVTLSGAAKQLDFAATKAAAEKAGWQVLTTSGTLVARRVDGGVTSWFKMSLPYRYDVLIARAAPALALVPPGAAVEDLARDADVPYLPPLPTMKRTRWEQVDKGAGVEVTAPGGAPTFVGPPYVHLAYTDDDGSGVEVRETYKPALEKAGWTIVVSNFAGVTIAHYAKDGRDVWVKLLGNRGMDLTVCDVGAAAAEAKLEAELTKHGHVALYGIYFDTDKDTIKPESEATLRQILALLAKLPTLHLEIQGHTDNTGAHDHNQTLSDARAAAVKKWLVDHQVDAARLTTKGYAETVPVDDNKTPSGRAHNRRVELAKAK